jgi:O-antigen/teichoic acid export membrane protein
MAASGFGVWSLVTGYVLDALVNSVVIWGFAPHRPRLGVDRKMLLEIIRFSLPLYLLSILFWIFWQGDDFMVGLAGDRSLGISGNIALGYYSIAFYFPHQLTRIRAELAGVSFPAFLALRDDIKRLSSAFQAVTRNNAIFILSVGAVAIPLAGPAVLYILGEKWLPSVLAFQVLMVAAMARTLFGAVGELYKSLGKTRALLWSYIPNPVLLILFGPYVALNHGILGMALLVTGIIVVTQPIGIFLTKRVLHDVNFSRLLWKPLIVFAITISAGWAISSHVETRTCFVASVLSLVLIYYGLMAAIDRRFRMTAIDYLRTSFRRPK